jgi:hypothetical protein
VNLPLQSNTGLTAEKILAAAKILDANECKSDMMLNPQTGELLTFMGFKFIHSYFSIRGAAKALRISRKRARWLELNRWLMICRR